MDKLGLIKRNTEETIGDLNKLVKKKRPRVYCGYETSGEVHLGHLVTMTKLLDLKKAGFKVVVLFADWHTWLNQKGDWNFIHQQIKNWEKAFKSAGLSGSEFVLGSKFQRNLNYIDDILTMSLKTTINRALRSMQQVARDIENAKVSQAIYPFMQIEDIKALKLDAVVAGIDQRKIHAMGIELFDKINFKTPVFIHTPIIPGLKGKEKMSSSDPSTIISVRDSEKEIKKKITNAYCPLSKQDNPLLGILKLIIFPRISKFKIERSEKFGGNLTLDSYEEVERLYLNKKIHPQDLKNSVSYYLIEILKPIRKAFSK